MTIYSYLQGGLGNQMFQYAIARALSERYQVNFVLDTSYFNDQPENSTQRQFQLELLNIKRAPYNSAPFPKKLSRFQKLMQGIFSKGPFVFYQKNAFDFDLALFNLKNIKHRKLYLSGYWQGFKYIANIHQILQQELQLYGEISSHYQHFLKDIIESESVMLHIRRGDYVNSPSAAEFHGALSLDYYLRAIEAVLAKLPNAHFFIFSDDLSWAKEMLPKKLQLTFVEHLKNEGDAAQELQLMRACKHHIIANSSLSWWGAWLKQDQSGFVYAPDRWIADPEINLANILPPHWQKLPA